MDERESLPDARCFAKEVVRLWAAGEQTYYDSEQQANLAACLLRIDAEFHELDAYRAATASLRSSERKLGKAREALKLIAGYIEHNWREGDAIYQSAIVARTALKETQE